MTSAVEMTPALKEALAKHPDRVREGVKPANPERPHVTDAVEIGEAYKAVSEAEIAAQENIESVEQGWIAIGAMLIDVRLREGKKFGKWLNDNEPTLGFARSKAYTMIKFARELRALDVAVFTDNRNRGRNSNYISQTERAVARADLGLEAHRRDAAARAQKSRDKLKDKIARLEEMEGAAPAQASPDPVELPPELPERHGPQTMQEPLPERTADLKSIAGTLAEATALATAQRAQVRAERQATWDGLDKDAKHARMKEHKAEHKAERAALSSEEQMRYGNLKGAVKTLVKLTPADVADAPVDDDTLLRAALHLIDIVALRAERAELKLAAAQENGSS